MTIQTSTGQTSAGKTLAEVAATSPGAVSTLERHGLDYCCGGSQSFDDACRKRGLAPEAVLQEITQAQSRGASELETKASDWQTAPLGKLARHIIATHHEYLKLELPALGNRLAKVLTVHGAKDPQTLHRLTEVFGLMRDELEQHMHKEEVVLFPFIEQYGRAEAKGLPLPPLPFGSIANPITVMEREHVSAGSALAEIRSLTNEFQFPPYACNTVRALWEGLRALETDLHLHIHLENNILFPRAIALESR